MVHKVQLVQLVHMVQLVYMVQIGHVMVQLTGIVI